MERQLIQTEALGGITGHQEEKQIALLMSVGFKLAITAYGMALGIIEWKEINILAV